MKNFPLFLVVTSLFFASCQKEDVYPPLSGSNAKLLKSVSVSDAETSTTTYTYTSDGKIDVINMTGTSGGMDIGNYRKFYRDANGRIIRIAEKFPPQNSIEADTVYTYVHYPDATTLNYDYTVQKIIVDVYEVNDSSLLTYNSNNQVIENYTYQTSTIFSPSQEIKIHYTYDAAGNATKIELYSNSTGAMELSSTFDVTYDDKTNPLLIDDQIMLISGGVPGSSANNVIVVKFKDVANPDTQTITNTYTYGTNGLPEKLVADDDFDGSITTTTTTFFYE